MPTQQDYDAADDRLREIVDRIGRTVFERKDRGDVATTLLLLLVREGNTWRTIRTLMRETQAELLSTVNIDVGTLLRAMFDAYLQVNYVLHDPAERAARAKLFLN